eukprot:2860585-Prymnesium_polylepis.1
MRVVRAFRQLPEDRTRRRILTCRNLVRSAVRFDQRRWRLEDTAILPLVRLQHVAHVGSRGLELRLLALQFLRSRQLPPRHLVVDRDD